MDVDHIDSSFSSSSDSDDESRLIITLLQLRRRRQNKRRKFRVHPLWMSRKEKGVHNNLIMEMALVDGVLFTNFTRMSVGQYENLLQFIGPELISCPTCRDIISPSTKLMVTLRFLATGESISSLHMQFRMGKSTVQKCIYDTLEILWNKLHVVVLNAPKTHEEWKMLADVYEEKWQFPHCWGAMDGKHIVMQAQPNSGSINYNYKRQHSLNLMAVCDADYKFIVVDVGGRGRESDGGVFRRSNFGKKLFNRQLNLPPPSAICPGGPILPYFCVADEAFPLDVSIMRPFPGRSTGRLPHGQKIYNYRLSRARRTIENAFGIMASQWRIFRVPINAREEHIKIIVLAAACLHNYLRDAEKDFAEDERRYCPLNLADRLENGVLIDGEWRQNVQMDAFLPLPDDLMQNLSGIRIQENLMNYFLNEGAVPWQEERIELVCRTIP